MAFLRDIWDISIPGQRMAQARDLRAQRAAAQAQRDREAAAFEAIQSGDVMGAAAQSPEIAGAYGDVQGDQDALRRQAGLRAVRAIEAAVGKGVPYEQAVGLVGRNTGQLFGSPDERDAVLAELLQGGPSTLAAYKAALTEPLKPGDLPSQIQVAEYYRNLSPQDKAVASEAWRTPKTFESGGSVRLVGPGGAQLELMSPEETARGEYRVKAAGAEGAATGKAAGEIVAEDLPRSQRASREAANVVDSRRQRLDLVGSTIDEAIKQANVFTTGIGSLSAALPGTPAANLAANLATIEANVGFDELQRLRDMSPTGGALGQVSERENVLLQSVLSALKQSQGPEQFKKNLERVKKQMNESWQRIADAYEADFGRPYNGPGGQDQGGAGIPEGVDPADWEFMTPDERALFE